MFNAYKGAQKIYLKKKILPNAETQEVGPREHVVTTHKDADVSHGNVLKGKYFNKTSGSFLFAKKRENDEMSSVIHTMCSNGKILLLISYFFHTAFPSVCAHL